MYFSGKNELLNLLLVTRGKMSEPLPLPVRLCLRSPDMLVINSLDPSRLSLPPNFSLIGFSSAASGETTVVE